MSVKKGEEKGQLIQVDVRGKEANQPQSYKVISDTKSAGDPTEPK